MSLRALMITGAAEGPPSAWSWISLTWAAMACTDTSDHSPRLTRMRTCSSESSTTSTTFSGACLALPMLGRSTTPDGSRGALTMKMISSTSITSMKGTMLISLRVRRRRPPPRALSSAISQAPSAHRVGTGQTARHRGLGHGCGGQRGRVTRQDVGELFHEGLHLDGDAVDVAGEAVVGQHRRDGGEQADGRGDQGLGDAGGHGGQRHLLHVRQAGEGVHDPPDGAEQADVRGHRAHRAQEVEPGLDDVHLALVAGAHGAAGAGQPAGDAGEAALALLHELAHAGGEDALLRCARTAFAAGVLEELLQGAA